MIDLKQVREIVNEHVLISVGAIEEPEPKITFAVRDAFLSPSGKECWRVNVTYTPKPDKPGELTWGRSASFRIDAESGDVMAFKEGSTWMN